MRLEEGVQDWLAMGFSISVGAALTGSLIGELLQSPLVLIAIASVLTAFAMSLFGFWELRLPFWLTQAASKAYTGFFGSFFMGITLGVMVGLTDMQL